MTEKMDRKKIGIPIQVVLAADKNNCIGANNGLPWGRIKADLKWFKERTLGSTLVMGSRTWNSLPKKLSGRFHVVLSSKPHLLKEKPDWCIMPSDIGSALPRIATISPYPTITLIGGKIIFESGLKYADIVYLTRIYKKYDGDVFVDIDETLKEFFYIESVKTQPAINDQPPLSFYVYTRKT